MSIELSKSQKKTARELIKHSLQIECARFLEEVKTSINTQKQEKETPHDAYLNLYEKVHTFDKHIARRYDDLRGSTYFYTLVELIFHGILTHEDLNRFDDKLKEELLKTVELWKKSAELL